MGELIGPLSLKLSNMNMVTLSVCRSASLDVVRAVPFEMAVLILPRYSRTQSDA